MEGAEEAPPPPDALAPQRNKQHAPFADPPDQLKQLMQPKRNRVFLRHACDDSKEISRLRTRPKGFPIALWKPSASPQSRGSEV